MPPLPQAAIRITGSDHDYDALLEAIGDAQYVLLGEASHGTHEFYRERARITRHLITHHGFQAVAVEADWPDAYRVNRYVKGFSQDLTPEEALGDFQRFPQWMWRNLDVVEFVRWLRAHNQGKEFIADRTGFYGIDLYSLNASMEAVLAYLEHTDEAAAARARERYACFQDFNGDAQRYGMLSQLGMKDDCRAEVVAQLAELTHQKLTSHSTVEADERFFAEQNALVVANAEHYYRTMFTSEENSWNVRDRHMAETVTHLMRHLETQVRRPRMVVWAHNSHLGDARATDQSFRGELNLGQLVREGNPPENVVSVGFSTYTGTVTAASNWDELPQHKRVRPGLPESYEDLLHQTGVEAFYVRTDVVEFQQARLQRAIGVIYRPETERLSHYYRVDLARAFDWIIYFDRTRGVVPLEPGERWAFAPGDTAEAFPTGL